MKKLNFTSLSLLLCVCLHAQSWLQKANYGGGNQAVACGFSINATGYILAGTNGSTYNNQVYAYDTTTNSWSAKNNFGGTARIGAGAISVNGYGYVIGGKDNSGFKADVWKYDPSADSWTAKTSCPGGGRYYAVAVANPVDGNIYYGTGDNGGGTYLSDFWQYNPSTDTWTAKAAFPGGQRSYGVGFCVNGEVYVGTGNNNDGTDGASNDFWKYDPGTNTWTQIANVPGYNRRDACTFVINNNGYVCLGTNSTYGELDDIYAYNSTNNTWTAVDNYGAGNSCGAVGFAIGSNGYIGTGYNSSNAVTNQFWELKVRTCDYWLQKANYGGGNQTTASGFSINATGYILAGTNGSTYNNQVYAYDTTTNTWSAKNNFGGTARIGAGAISINGYGYVIGGKDNSGFKADVWKYDPNADSWTAKTSCPGGGRYYAVAVANPVDGNIYYGTGDNGGGTYLSDFWQYNPSTDTWTAKAAFPGGQRSYGVGFCVNGEVYVGTGNNNDGTDGASNDFWKYDPGTNTWTQIANVPGYNRRDACTFVINNNGYVCLGTNSTYGELDDIYAYNSTNNTWTAVDNYGAGNSCGAVGFAIGSNGYIGTGYNSSNAVTNQFWEYILCETGPESVIEIVSTAASIKIYPNPTNGVLDFSYSGLNNTRTELRITDMLGKLINSYWLNSNEAKLRIDETFLQNGMYFYQLVNENEIFAAGKFIIAK